MAKFDNILKVQIDGRELIQDLEAWLHYLQQRVKALEDLQQRVKAIEDLIKEWENE